MSERKQQLARGKGTLLVKKGCGPEFRSIGIVRALKAWGHLIRVSNVLMSAKAAGVPVTSRAILASAKNTPP